MDLSQLILNPTNALYAISAMGVLGGFLWWLVRKKQKRIWLPTLRVLDIESRLLPKMIVQKPPLLAFLVFLICAIVMALFTLQPSRQLYTPFEPGQMRIHLFVDFSPSVSAATMENSYKSKIEDLWNSLKGQGRVTISTSHSAKFFEPSNVSDIKQNLASLGFHREGLKIGPAIKKQMETLGDVDRLFIVGDSDVNSWTGFNWRYLLDEMDVQFVDFANAGTDVVNYFINQVEFVSNPSATISEWDVEIVRKGPNSEQEGRVTAVADGKELGSFNWSIPQGKGRATVRVNWPSSQTVGLDSNKDIVWNITVPKEDSIEADNIFRSKIHGIKQNIVLVSESTGEMLLDDPVNQLQIALEVQGFNVKRYDQVNQPGPEAKKYPLWILVGGLGSGVDQFCPKSLGQARRSEANQLKYQEQNIPQPNIWLAPIVADADFKELCQCYFRTMMAKNELDRPIFCENVESRNHWLGLMPSLGAFQIGGELGTLANSLAFNKIDKNSGMGMLAFTIPLRPTLAGINHAQFPIFLKQILAWQKMVDSDGTNLAADWPRTEDIATSLWAVKRNNDDDKPMKTSLHQMSNVPVGESLLANAKEVELPPKFIMGNDWSKQQLPVKKDKDDPLPWLKFGVLLVLIFCALEALVGIGGHFRKMLAKGSSAALLVVLIAGLNITDKADAGIEVSTIGYSSGLGMEELSREVAHRTSLDLNVTPDSYSVFDPKILNAPWIWTKSLQQLINAKGEFKPQVATWMRRGGLLIIDGAVPEESLRTLTSELVPARLATQNNGSWMPIPPDHELMRSFYLLDALPVCGNQFWKGYHFDGRLAIVQIPLGFLDYLNGLPSAASACGNGINKERSIRIFVNLLMVALATDYKKDQIHLPEILKRLR